nr:hypothetical protein [Tanacetum cinerariifolium]
MALSIMKEKFISMVESEKEKAKLMVSNDLSIVESKKGKAKLMTAFIDDKGNGKVDDLQNRVERLKGDLARAEKGKAKLMVSEKRKAKVDALDDVDMVDAFDLENRIKNLSEDFNRLLKAKKAKEAKEAEEAELKVKRFFSDEDVVLFNDVKYPLSDAEIRMFEERSTTLIAPLLPQDPKLLLLPQDLELLLHPLLINKLLSVLQEGTWK